MNRSRSAAVPAAGSCGVPPQSPDRGSATRFDLGPHVASTRSQTASNSEVAAGHRPAVRRITLRELLLSALVCIALLLPQAESRAAATDRFELRAILTVAGARHAMFADTDNAGKTHMLRFRESKGDLQLASLDPATGSVVIKHRGRRHEMQMDSPPDPATASPRGVIWLQEASIDDITEIYQRITTRTVLRDSNLGNVAFTFREQNVDTPTAADRLIEAFTEQGIELIKNGKRFAIAKRKGARIPALPNYAQIIESASDTSKKTSDSGLYQTGSIQFPGIDLNAFLDFYAELTGRTILKPTALQAGPIALTTQTDMNRWEAVYALDMTLALNGLKSTFLGDKFTAITPLDYDTDALTQPPDPDPDADQLKAGAITFANAPASQAFQRYQELASLKISSEAHLEDVSISLRNHTPLAANEAVWAIETALRLNGIHLQPTDENSVQAAPLAQAPDRKN